jgi:hypothetical protein
VASHAAAQAGTPTFAPAIICFWLALAASDESPLPQPASMLLISASTTVLHTFVFILPLFSIN